MIETRNSYGFPLLPSEAVRVLWNLPAAPRRPTKLEHAQAYAADVRARKFKPVTRLKDAP